MKNKGDSFGIFLQYRLRMAQVLSGTWLHQTPASISTFLPPTFHGPLPNLARQELNPFGVTWPQVNQWDFKRGFSKVNILAFICFLGHVQTSRGTQHMCIPSPSLYLQALISIPYKGQIFLWWDQQRTLSPHYTMLLTVLHTIDLEEKLVYSLPPIQLILRPDLYSSFSPRDIITRAQHLTL